MKHILPYLLIFVGMSVTGCSSVTSLPFIQKGETAAPGRPDRLPDATGPEKGASVQPPRLYPRQEPDVSDFELRPYQAPAPGKPSAEPSTSQPEIRPGECWVQAVIHPKPVRKPVDIVVRDAVNDIDVTPAEIEPAWQKVVVREGGITYRIEPPVYKRVIEKVVVRPEIRRTIVVPAVYEEQESVIEIEAARTVLERCKVSTAVRSSDIPVQALCARLIPARSKTVKRKLLVQPETTREEVEPAVYKEITRWVIETPARAVPVETPPEMGSMRVRKIAAPEQVEEEQLPPQVRHFVTTQYEGSPSIIFRRVLCDQEVTPERIQALQGALKQAGFDPGTSDGKLGKRTFAALLEYQRQNGLAHGALTHESLEQLGIKAAH
ncbi:MAG: hypothetical protein FNT29_01760 [Halothiobacillaceae bacterium]|nr:MAG: hypothetical protein FNT29_01760 [Halothiobacillaceae bacterium]